MINRPKDEMDLPLTEAQFTAIEEIWNMTPIRLQQAMLLVEKGRLFFSYLAL